MKKALLLLSIIGLGIAGLTSANAQYYDNYYNTSYDSSYNSMYYNSTYTTAYTQPAYTSYYGGGSNYGYYGTGGTGSYTIGCTTYYYNTRTGAQLYTQQICNNTPVYTQPTYSYPVQYSYPTTYTQPSQYYTYGYSNGSWYPGYSSGGIFGLGNIGNTNSNYGCYYQNGYQICY